MAAAITTDFIAYSGTIRCDTAAHLMSDIDAVFKQAGYQVFSAGSGFEYQAKSGQNYGFRVKVEDTGAFVGPFRIPAIDLTPISSSGLIGTVRHLIWGPSDYAAQMYQMIASNSWVFISLNGVDQHLNPVGDIRTSHSFSAGTLFVPANLSGACRAPSPHLTTEILWANGSGDDLTATNNFRNNYTCLKGVQTVVLNGSIENIAETQGFNALQIYPLTPTWSSLVYNYPLSQIYKTSQPLFMDPFVGWGGMKGQLYDAMYATGALGLDGQVTTVETDSSGHLITAFWKVWSSTPLFSLLLRYGILIPVANTPGIAGYAY